MLLLALISFLVVSTLPLTAYTQSVTPRKVTYTTDITSPSRLDPETLRFTASYAKEYYRGWKLSILELAWKFPKQKSIIKIGIGGSQTKTLEKQAVEGDVYANFVSDMFSITIVDDYTLTKIEKQQMWVGQLTYEYLWSLKQGKVWKFPYEFYASAGVMGQYSFILASGLYSLDVVLPNDAHFSDSLDIPNGLKKKNFSANFPACMNFDLSMVTLRGCGLFNTEDFKHPAAYGAVGFGF